ncbi:gag/pol/env polyprotein, putative [Perkinsus marinus ATCC 50983]|uniref:Gag/pol/env polyprotein, putative n=1 Tax=Perkinsus marinus (strain ATCC 50983 / TXsc) TaxID=423536 RepID=C5LV36_PERM5|nr:gag/pol/env polyprotein, putative [Perkinsus marinus ATCC 50983]EEQ99404.1 gag/pol/env polyprotein, putative [Perkinsus marinus ATCC 50983]|eukprot:XP_002766687.1 gag/pol/env polyprotein, putative [Perkinsus marinus ATCC 50983]
MRESGLALRVLPKAELSALESEALDQRGVGPELYYSPSGNPNVNPHAPQGLAKSGDTDQKQPDGSRKARNKKKHKVVDGKFSQGSAKPTKVDVKNNKRDPKKVLAFKEGRCFDCNEKGHRASECLKRVVESSVAIEKDGSPQQDQCGDPQCTSHFVSTAVAVSYAVPASSGDGHNSIAGKVASLGLISVKQNAGDQLPPLPVANIECKKRHPTIRHRGYPLAPEKRRIAEETLRDYEKKGYIEFIDKDGPPDQWISPCFLKRKKSDAWRLLTDLRSVNKRLPIPRWATSFASLDVKDAFYTVRVSHQSSELLGATVGYHTFRWKVLAQGLCTAPYWWSRQIHWILSGISELDKFKGRVVVLTFVDDILICGDAVETTRAVLEIICKRLADYHIPISPEKTQPPTDIIGFLGMRLSSNGWQPEPAAVAALESLPRTLNKQQLQSVLGTINYLRAAYGQGELQVNLAPLQDILGKNKPYKWTDLHDAALDWLRSALRQHVFDFQPIDSELEEGEGFVLQTDASDCGISYVLWRVRFGECPGALSEMGDLNSEYSGPTPDILAEHGAVLMVGSRRLRGHEKRYATFDCEGLALVEGLRRARLLLLIATKSGRRAPVVVQSDSAVAIHKVQAVPDYSEFTRNQVRYKRWCRWVESVVDVLPFVRIFHCRGSQNCLSDMFSRVLAEADTDTMGVYSTTAVLVCDNFDNSSLCSEEDDEALMNDSLPTDDGVAVLPVAGQRLEEDVPPELIGLVNSNGVRRVDLD